MLNQNIIRKLTQIGETQEIGNPEGKFCKNDKKEFYNMGDRIVRSSEQIQYDIENYAKNNNIILLSKYENAKTTIKCKCAICGLEWTSKPYSFKHGTVCCRKCHPPVPHLSQQEFEDRVKKINPHLKILGEYKGYNYDINFLCLKHNKERTLKAYNLLKPCGCDQCTSESMRNNSVKDPKVFLKQASEKLPHVKIIGKYQHSNIPIKCYCLKHKIEYETLPRYIVEGHGECPKCHRENVLKANHACALSNEEFVDRLKKCNPTIIPLEPYFTQLTKIKVKCSLCGKIYMATPAVLMRGGDRCSECYKNISDGEKKVELYLTNHAITFEPHKRFAELRGLTNPLSYDFYIPSKNLLIEYQGEQHYKPVEVFGGEKAFITQQEHDKQKKEYAEKNNYNLLCIPYWDKDNIDELLDSYFYKNPVTTTVA